MLKAQRINIADPVMQEAIYLLDRELFPNGLVGGRETAGAWWVVRDGQDVAAYAGMTPSATTPNAGYLCRAGVLPRYRGAGLQKHLIRLRVAHARAKGWRTVISDTKPTNLASANSLIACGFRLFKPEKPWAIYPSPLYWRREV